MSAPVRIAARARARAGFTLLEMLVVVGFTATLLTFAVAFYVDLTRGSAAATELVGRERRATALLDRVARDLEHAVLVKKPDARDPLEHPWLFLAESRDSPLGADRLKFDVRAGRAPATERASSDLSVVAWFALPGSDEGLELWRWASPRLPERLDREFPEPEAPGAHRVASGLAEFGVRLLGAEGSWSDAWDSSTLARSGELPLAAEITVAFPPEEAAPAGTAPREHTRRVLLRMRPLDLQERLGGDPSGTGEGEGEDGEEGEEGADGDDSAGGGSCSGLTAGQCNPDPQALQALGIPPEVVQSVLSSNPDRCIDDLPSNIRSIARQVCQ